MFVYGSIEDHMFVFLTGFFFTSLEMFLYIKNEIIDKFIGKFLIYQNIYFIISTSRTSRGSPAELGKHRAPPESPEKLRLLGKHQLCRRAPRSCD